jgi:hypothetical protein
MSYWQLITQPWYWVHASICGYPYQVGLGYIIDRCGKIFF